jgi:hypothetical protein
VRPSARLRRLFGAAQDLLGWSDELRSQGRDKALVKPRDRAEPHVFLAVSPHRSTLPCAFDD